MATVIVTVLVTVTKSSESLTLSHPDLLENPGDLADLVDPVVSNKSYRYIEFEHHQIIIMQ